MIDDCDVRKLAEIHPGGTVTEQTLITLDSRATFRASGTGDFSGEERISRALPNAEGSPACVLSGSGRGRIISREHHQ